MGYTAPNERKVVNDKEGRMRDEAVSAYFRVTSYAFA
jgi:hypothetical protein